jgi:ribosome maturation factor RimP
MVQVFAEKLQGIRRGPLEAAIGPVLSAHGVDTAEVSYQMEPSGWVLRVTVESLAKEGDAPAAEATPMAAASPIDLGLLTEISRDLSSALDVADVIPHRYQLEVSSPGLDRPLRTARDYMRAVGLLAKIRLVNPAPDGQRVLRGRILESNEFTVAIDVDGKPMTVPFTDVERAHLIFELPARPKMGHAKPGKPKRH